MMRCYVTLLLRHAIFFLPPRAAFRRREAFAIDS